MPGLIADGGGLYLQVSTGGTKAWLFRYMRSGRARKMGLGPVHTVTLAAARESATEARRAILAGLDPIDERLAKRQAARLAVASIATFREVAERYVEAHRAGWRNEKHAGQWTATLVRYVYPVIGGLSVASIDSALVLKIVEPIWSHKPETAKRVRGRIEAVLDYAKARGLRSGDNPAAWKGHLDKLLPSPSKVRQIKHHHALPYEEMPEFVCELRLRSSVSAKALEFLILTAARTGEVIGARWSEIDRNAQVWTIPARRMKGGREHRVPLSRRALEIFDELSVAGEFVFRGRDENRPLSNMALLEMVRGLSESGETVHGFRSTFRDWAAEQTSYPNFVVEMALAHAVADKVEAAYRRGDLLLKRTQLMADWATYCDRTGKSARIYSLHGSTAATS
jgi:integrase